jgi:mono/diheme cytochrome c family protein
MNFRAFSIGFSTAVLALACGGSDSGGDDNNDPAPTAGEEVTDVPVTAPRETCDDNPLLAGCVLPENDQAGNPIDQPDPTPPPAGGNRPVDLARAGATNVLASNCGQCHGPALTPLQASAGMNYIQDMDKLAENGKLIPGNSAGSRIIQRMKDGSMPPLTSGKAKVSDADIDVVAQFIDNPSFWPDADINPVDCTDQLFDFDQLYGEVARDLRLQDNEDALTTRYIALTNRFTAGVCADTTLDRDRQALFKMLNALSKDTTISKPEPVDAAETIYRIDLKDYGWDQPIQAVIDGVVVDAVDSWELIASVNAYAVEFFGDDADDAKLDSNTQFPVMLADSLLDAATIGNVYYALIGVNVQDTLDNFILNDLDIDVAQNLLDEEQVRAGTTRSRISRQDRVVQRDDIEIRSGVLWQSFDFEDDQNESIFENPFGFAEGGTEAIFTLPNGMFGFIIADADSNIVEDSDILLDTSQNNFRAVTSISCSNCHSQGLIPVADEVRDIALANARVTGLNNDEVEQLRAVYPSAAEFADIVDEDSQQFYKAALTKAGVELQGVEPVSSVFFRFDQDMKLADAAGDLGLTADELADNLDILNPALNVLDRGVMDRDDFTQFYIDSLCRLQVVAVNAPDPVLCADIDANGGIVP